MKDSFWTAILIALILTSCTTPMRHLNPRPSAHGQLQNAAGCNARTSRCQ